MDEKTIENIFTIIVLITVIIYNKKHLEQHWRKTIIKERRRKYRQKNEENTFVLKNIKNSLGI